MSISTDIKRILWHEMGHFCVDLLIVESHHELKINKLSIGHQNFGDDLFNWNGHVEMLPPLSFENIVDDYSIMAYSLISLQAGCLFETLFFQQVLKDTTKKFEDCFSNKRECIGNGDWQHYCGILSAVRKIHPEFRGKKDLNELLEIDFFTKVRKSFNELKDFIESLEVIIDEEALIIENDFNQNKAPGQYSYNYTDKELSELAKKVLPIMSKYQFREKAKEIHDSFIETYSSFIVKYSPKN